MITLCIHCLLIKVYCVSIIIGEAEMQIGDVTRPITTWLSLSDSKHNNSIWGELMFSISYLPTAERLTVVVVKARNLKLPDNCSANCSLQNVFVKVVFNEIHLDNTICNNDYFHKGILVEKRQKSVQKEDVRQAK